MRKILISIAVFCLTVSSYAAGVAGIWQTIDDETGKPKSIVSVYENNGVIYAKILVTYNDAGSLNITKDAKGHATCNSAKIAEKMEGKPPYCGLVIVKDMKPTKTNRYHGGTITDPKKGKTYRAEMWRDGDNLVVRGKLGPFGRNQTWLPFAEEDLPVGII